VLLVSVLLSVCLQEMLAQAMAAMAALTIVSGLAVVTSATLSQTSFLLHVGKGEAKRSSAGVFRLDGNE
jgi:hypothetical protein